MAASAPAGGCGGGGLELASAGSLTVGGSSQIFGQDSIPASWSATGLCDPTLLSDAPGVMIDDATGKGTCIVDLDTVMPGLSLYDFGDAIRSMANQVDEDQPDLPDEIGHRLVQEILLRPEWFWGGVPLPSVAPPA